MGIEKGQRINTRPSGERFGNLEVIRRVQNDRWEHPVYELKCDCGSVVNVSISALARKKRGKTHCGCNRKKPSPMSAETKKKISEANTKVVIGEKYGQLTVLGRSPEGTGSRKDCTYYRCLCDCGGMCDTPNKKIRKPGHHWNRHCGGPLHGKKQKLRYPPTPTPYPDGAAEVAKANFKVLQWISRFDDAGAYEIAHERFLRACFLVYWRQRYGKPVANVSNYIFKSVSYSKISARRQRAAERRGGILYNDNGKKLIGGVVTNSTITVQAIIETLPDVDLPKSRPQPNKKKHRFRRC